MTQDSLPGAVAIGIDYYVLRWRDYLSRHADQSAAPVQPPDYYLAYGNKYCRRFRLEARHLFTPLGQAWIDRTCDLLQQALERKRAEDARAFARLEEESAAFRCFAYSNHAAAYIQGGIAVLPMRDLVLLIRLIDLRDLLPRAGLQQIALVLVFLGKIYSRRAFDWLKEPVIRNALAFLKTWFAFWQSAISMNYLPEQLHGNRGT